MVSYSSIVEKNKHTFMFEIYIYIYIYRKSCLNEIMSKNTVQPDRPEKTIKCDACAFYAGCIRLHTHTHTHTHTQTTHIHTHTYTHTNTHTYTHTHKIRIYNIYRFSTAAMVARTLLINTYIACRVEGSLVLNLSLYLADRQIEVRKFLLSFGAESFVFHVAIQKFKNQDI